MDFFLYEINCQARFSSFPYKVFEDNRLSVIHVKCCGKWHVLLACPSVFFCCYCPAALTTYLQLAYKHCGFQTYFLSDFFLLFLRMPFCCFKYAIICFSSATKHNFTNVKDKIFLICLCHPAHTDEHFLCMFLNINCLLVH